MPIYDATNFYNLYQKYYAVSGDNALMLDTLCREAEPIVDMVLNKYFKQVTDQDFRVDLKQEGLIAVWRVVKDRKLAPERPINQHVSYLRLCIKHTLSGYCIKMKPNYECYPDLNILYHRPEQNYRDRQELIHRDYLEYLKFSVKDGVRTLRVQGIKPLYRFIAWYHNKYYRFPTTGEIMARVKVEKIPRLNMSIAICMVHINKIIAKLRKNYFEGNNE